MSKTYHILNGDALLDLLPETILSGDVIVARECLIDGPLNGETLEKFWETRANFIATEYEEERESYFHDVVPEFNRIMLIQEKSEVNLWFEEDLFCQVNLWFCISLLNRISDQIKINIVKPPLKDGRPDWRGFGALDRDELAKAYQDRQRLRHEEIDLSVKLWIAYKNQDKSAMAELGNQKTVNFPFLQEVIQAQLDRFSEDNLSGRPERVLKDIILTTSTKEFKNIFKEFSIREGIYGFGDWQVESILNKLPEYQPD